MALYKNQSNLAVELDAVMDVDAASVKQILYEKPSGVKGAWTATSNVNILSYQLTDADIDEVGTWKLQSYVEMGAQKAYGTIVHVYFDQHIKA